VLGLEANGVCECSEGFYGPTCIKGLGFDLENTESICQGNGYITTIYERSIEDVFDTFEGIKCVCEDQWTPAFGEDACSCKEQNGQCVDCAFGYYRFNGTCNVCPGGAFTRACNMKYSGGVCQNDGTCKCRVSYVSGGYKGESCQECVNNNFFHPPTTNEPICLPCPGAFGEGFHEACGGHGVCITQNRLAYWDDVSDPNDSYDLYAFQVGPQKQLTKEELANTEIGKCQCFENYALNTFGICS
jgi:hypothetical protein